MIGWVVLAILAVVIFWAIFTYNHFVSLRNQVQEGWSGIDVQLKRRHNLIPNLVASVQGYKNYEQSVLTEVTTLRTNAENAQGIPAKANAESALGNALGKFFAVAENYPDLKASQNFLDLQKQLSEVEDNIQNARRYYNGTARDFNTGIQQFPANLIAGMANFTKFDYFKIDVDAERSVPTVDFSESK
jgi:LemA protein